MKEIPDIHLDLKKTALLIVDMQKHFIAKDGYDALQCKEAGEWDEWEWFYDHVEKVVIPNNKRLLDCCRKNGVEVTYGRIASLKKDGSDRSPCPEHRWLERYLRLCRRRQCKNGR